MGKYSIKLIRVYADLETCFSRVKTRNNSEHIAPEDLQAHPEVVVTDSFDEFKEIAQSKVALWIDINAVDLVDLEWLGQSPQAYYPIVLGRCVKITPAQRIKLSNQSNGPIDVQFGEYHLDLPVGGEVLLDKPASQYLALGVHSLPMGPELWVRVLAPGVTPVATRPGPLRNYENHEVGYMLTLPPGWNVDESGLTATSREVRFYPPNAEPFISYLDIGLDPRSLEVLRKQDVPGAHKVDIFYAGQNGVQYVYASGRSKIYLQYESQVYYLFTDEPVDASVQQMMGSFTFIP